MRFGADRRKLAPRSLVFDRGYLPDRLEDVVFKNQARLFADRNVLVYRRTLRVDPSGRESSGMPTLLALTAVLMISSFDFRSMWLSCV